MSPHWFSQIYSPQSLNTHFMICFRSLHFQSVFPSRSVCLSVIFCLLLPFTQISVDIRFVSHSLILSLYYESPNFCPSLSLFLCLSRFLSVAVSLSVCLCFSVQMSVCLFLCLSFSLHSSPIIPFLTPRIYCLSVCK